MRKSLAIALLLSVSIATPSIAEDNTDACGAVLCLAGEMAGTGDGGASCSPYSKQYFDIQVWKKGKFKPPATSAARQSWLSTCQSAEAGIISAITSAFGTELR